MEPLLAIALIDKGALKSGTEVEAQYLANGLGGTTRVLARGEFTIHEIVRVNESTVSLRLISTQDGVVRTSIPDAIISIDGMDPVRYASVYGIKANGLTAKEGKRRGRKPKIREAAQ